MSICLARTTSTQQPNMPKSCIRATLHSVKLFTELCLAHAHNNFLVTDLRRKIAIAIKLMKMKMKKLCISLHIPVHGTCTELKLLLRIMLSIWHPATCNEYYSIIPILLSTYYSYM